MPRKNSNLGLKTLNETADLLRVSERTIRRMIDVGEIRSVRFGPVLAVHDQVIARFTGKDEPEGRLSALLTLTEVADRLDCTPADVRAYTMSGRLAHVPVGGSVRWRASDVERFRSGDPGTGRC